MTRVTGDIRLVTNQPANVTQVWVRAARPRVQGTVYVAEAPDVVAVNNGKVTFDALPGAALMTLVQHGQPMSNVKLLVPDKTTATLRECIEAADLIDDGTFDALELLAQNIAADAAKVGTAAQVATWADEAKTAEQTAKRHADDAREEADRAGRAADIIPGLVDDDSTDNTAAIQAAVDQGGRWRLPPTTGRYYVSGEVSLTVSGTELYAQGAPIRQGQNSLFRAIASDLRIDGVDSIGAAGLPDFTGMTAAWEGTISASRWCVVNVYAGAHRLNIPWIRGRGMSSVVRSGGWDATTDTATTTRTDDISIGTLLCSRVEFGVALKGTNRLHISDLRGTYGDTVTAPRPPHLLYLADNHKDVTVLSAVAQDGVGGHAHQIKQVNGGVFGSLQATHCNGALNLMDCADVEIESVISRGDRFSGTQGGAVMMDHTTATSNIHIGRVRVDMETDNRAVNIINGDRITIDAVDVTVAHATTGASSDYDVTIGGTRCEIRNISVVNTGSKAWKAVGVWGTGTGNRVHARELRGVRVGLDARNSPDAVLEYDADRIIIHPTDGLYALTTSALSGLAQFQAPQTQVLRDRAVVADNFTVRAGSASEMAAALTGQTWRSALGIWRSSDSGVYITTDVVRARTFLDTGSTNITVSADVTFDGACGLIVKATNSDQADFLYVMLTNSEVSLLVNGVETIATVPRTHQAGRTYHVEASYFGGAVDVIIDSLPVLSHTLTSTQADVYSPATYAGLCTSSAQARFRNFKAVAI